MTSQNGNIYASDLFERLSPYGKYSTRTEDIWKFIIGPVLKNHFDLISEEIFDKYGNRTKFPSMEKTCWISIAYAKFHLKIAESIKRNEFYRETSKKNLSVPGQSARILERFENEIWKNIVSLRNQYNETDTQSKLLVDDYDSGEETEVEEIKSKEILGKRKRNQSKISDFYPPEKKPSTSNTNKNNNKRNNKKKPPVTRKKSTILIEKKNTSSDDDSDISEIF